MSAEMICNLINDWDAMANGMESLLSAMPLDVLPEDHPAHSFPLIYSSCLTVVRHLKNCADSGIVSSQQKETILKEIQRSMVLCARVEGSWSGNAASLFARKLMSLYNKTNTLLETCAQPAITRKEFVFTPVLFPNRHITLRCENLARSQEEYDAVICSSFKNNYYPLPGTLIGALYTEKNISVTDLAKSPQIDLRTFGCWLSGETESKFRHIGCVELLDLKQRHIQPSDMVLKSAFSTLRFLLEQAHISGIALRKIALPILGAGCQGIDLNYIIPPLYAQCLALFSSINTLESIDIYDLKADRIDLLAGHIAKLEKQDVKKSAQVMISYNSAQSDLAHHVHKILSNDGIHTWIAPESIPTGSDYTAEITKAIVNAKVVTLLYSPEAQLSPWVRKEIISAIGANKIVLPLQLIPFPMDDGFRYMFSDIQIFPLWKYDEKYKLDVILDEVRSRM